MNILLTTQEDKVTDDLWCIAYSCVIFSILFEVKRSNMNVTKVLQMRKL